AAAVAQGVLDCTGRSNLAAAVVAGLEATSASMDRLIAASLDRCMVAAAAARLDRYTVAVAAAAAASIAQTDLVVAAAEQASFARTDLAAAAAGRGITAWDPVVAAEKDPAILAAGVAILLVSFPTSFLVNRLAATLLVLVEHNQATSARNFVADPAAVAIVVLEAAAEIVVDPV
ncbi:hypothetical protein H0H93_016063, partial [Arthromyces matolae]